MGFKVSTIISVIIVVMMLVTIPFAPPITSLTMGVLAIAHTLIAQMNWEIHKTMKALEEKTNDQ